MTIPVSARRMPPYAGNGVTTSFAYNFYVSADSELLIVEEDDVTEARSTLVLDTDYTVTGVGAEAGGNVVLTDPLATGKTLYVIGNTLLTQPTDFKNQSSWQGKRVESSLDRIEGQIQELSSLALKADDRVSLDYDAGGRDIVNIGGAYVDELYIGGALVVPEDMAFSLPDPTGNANEFAVVNSLGTAYETKTHEQADVQKASDIQSGQAGATKFVTTVAAMKALTGLVNGARINLGGWHEKDDGGGGDLTFHSSSVGTADDGYIFDITAGGQVRRTTKALTARHYGAKGDDSTDDTDALQRMKDTWGGIVIDRGVYRYTAITGLDVDEVYIIGGSSNDCKLKCAANASIALDIGTSAGFRQGTIVRGVTIEGNSTTTIILRASAIARSWWDDVNVRECNPSTGVGFRFRGCSLNNFRNLVCSQDREAMTNPPSEACQIEALSPFGNSSNNTFTSCYFEGDDTANGIEIGVRISGGDQNTFTGGSPESCYVYGLLIAAGSRYNTFIGVGFENINATADYLDGGESNAFINCYSSKSVLLQGRAARIEGGFYERVQVDSGAVKNRVQDVRLNNWRTGSGGFFDSGTATEWKNLRGTRLTATFATSVMTVTAVGQGTIAVGDEVFADGVATGTTITSFGTGTGGTGTYNLSTSPGTLGSRTVSTGGHVYPFKSRTSITVGASAFTWTNTTGQYVQVIVQGGTVTQIRQLREGDAWLKPATSPTAHLVAPLEQLEVSYSSAPTMSYTPENGFQG